LPIEANLDFAMLPLAQAQGSDEHDKRAAGRKMLFEPGLPGLAGGEAVPVEERVEPRVFQVRAQRLRGGQIRPRVAQENIVIFRPTLHRSIRVTMPGGLLPGGNLL
jgi:hypothetical protein